MESNSNSDSTDPGLKRTRCNSGDSDLMVLSVVLNKKQKENDEVSKSIERLRANGVNCVIFTMNDIRNGNMKGDSPCDCFRFSTVPPKMISSMRPCLCKQRSSMKSDAPLQNRSAPVPPTTPENKMEVRSCDLVLSPTPSPSPPPPQPVSPPPLTENSDNSDANDVEIIEIPDPDVAQNSSIVKKKNRRKRRYPYATRKPTRSKKRMLKQNIREEEIVVKECPTEVGAGASRGDKPSINITSPSTTKVEAKTDKLEVGPAEAKVTIDVNDSKSAKKKGRKSRSEKFEETFQIAVQSFVETTKKRHRHTKMHIPVLTRSTRSRSCRTVAESSNLSNEASTTGAREIKCEQNVQYESTRRKAARTPKKLKTTPNVKAICIRNIFVGPTIIEQKHSTGTKLESKSVGPEVKGQCEESNTKESLSDHELTHTPLNLGKSSDSTTKNNSVKKIDEPEHNQVQVLGDANCANGILRKNPEDLVACAPLNRNVNIEIGLNRSLDRITSFKVEDRSSEESIVPVQKQTEKIEKSKTRNGTLKFSSSASAILEHNNEQGPRITTTQTIIVDHFKESRETKKQQQDKKVLRAFSPDITSRAMRKKKVPLRVSRKVPTGTPQHNKASELSANTDDTRDSQSCRSKSGNSSQKDDPLLPCIPEVQMQEVKETLEALISSVVFCMEMELTIPKTRGEWDGMPDIQNQSEQDHLRAPDPKGDPDEPPLLTLAVDLKPNCETLAMPNLAAVAETPVTPGLEDSLPDLPDSMQLRRSSFYPLVTGNVRVNLENYLDGKVDTAVKSLKRRKRAKNGFLLHHGDNCPENPESPYRLHLATQVLLKLNRRRSKCKPKEERTKNALSYLKLIPNRPVRVSKGQTKVSEEPKSDLIEEPVFSGEWSLKKKFICGVCGQQENCFWDMVTHKGEEHIGVVVTHVELPPTHDTPQSLIRTIPTAPVNNTGTKPSACSKCFSTFSTVSDLHSHIFECAGNVSWLAEKAPAKRKARKRGFKRRFSNTSKKQKRAEGPKRRCSELLHKCMYCTREFKTEGWLKNHMMSHSLPISIPLDKLPLASLPVRASLKKSIKFTHHLRNSPHPLPLIRLESN